MSKNPQKQRAAKHNRAAIGAALRDAHERAKWLARFPEENPNPVQRISFDGNVLYCNPAAAGLPGWTCEVGKPLPDPLLPLIRQAMREGREIQQDLELGGKFYSISVTPFAEERYANVYGRDITGHKQAEKTLHRYELISGHTRDIVLFMQRDGGRLLEANAAAMNAYGYSREELLTLTIHDLRAPDMQRLTSGQMAEADAQGILFETTHQRKDGSTFPVEVSSRGATIGGTRTLISVIRDITKRKQAEEALHRNEARSKLLSETAGRLLSTGNPQGIVNDLCRDVMEHLDCQVFFNFLVDEAAGRLHLNACAGIPEEEARKIEWLDYGIAVCGCAARDGVRIVVENIGSTPDPRTDLVKSYGVQAYACHPLKVQGRLIGTLSFGTKTRTSFSLEDLTLMRTVTDQVATAMERIRLIKDLQRSRDELESRVRERTGELAKANEELRHLSSRLLSAQEDERRRVALEIHDTIGACLNAVKFKVEGAIQQVGGTTSAEGESLKNLVPVIQESIDECRRIQMDLRPSMLDDLGLLPTFSWFFRNFRAVYSKIQVEQKIEVKEDEVPRSLRVVIFRVTQEAMNNIAKHSKADLVHVSLRRRDGRMELMVEDNGQGFDLEKVLALESTRRGLGISSMGERVALSGGSFAIDSTAEKGTIVHAYWPLSERG